MENYALTRLAVIISAACIFNLYSGVQTFSMEVEPNSIILTVAF
jgi:hypothetical protein